MVGRTAECAAVIAGPNIGPGTVIVGEPGVGKPALAVEIAARQGRRSWRTALVIGGDRATLTPQALREWQPATGNRQAATGNRQPATG